MTKAENPKHYRYKKRMDIDDPTLVQKDASGKLRSIIKRDQCQAVIIHPSLGAPLLVEAGKPVSFFILANDKLLKLHTNSQASRNPGLEVRQIITLHTRYQVINEAFRDKTKPLKEQILVSPNRNDLEKKIDYQFIGDIRGLSGRLRNFDDNKPFIGLLHPLAQAHFGAEGFHYLFEVSIKDLPLTEGQLYDLSWIGYHEAKERETTEGTPLVEWQDDFAKQFLEEDEYIGEPQHECSPLSTDAFGTGDGTPLESHHPIWVAPAGKPRLGIGHLTDVHVSSRQHAFRKSQARLIPKTSTPIGPRVNTSYDSLKDLMTQFGEDSEIDLLIFTGDLIDYGRNYNPSCMPDSRTGTLWKEMNLDRLNLRDEKGNLLRDSANNIQPDTKRYPRGIDNAIVYSLLRWYMKTYNKPVLLTSGNHESYTLPYGISPRVKLTQDWRGITPGHELSQEESVEIAKTRRDKIQTKQTKKKVGVSIYDERANEGIPADHNLTIPEATLMYGPDYAKVIFGGAYRSTGQQNFKAKNLDWFTVFYNPLSDFCFTWNEQCIISLGWGDNEKFIDFLPNGQGGSFLPRATEALSKSQRDLLETALSYKKPCNLLCSHFTYANFEQERPIKGETKPLETRKICYRRQGSQWQEAMLSQKQELQDEADARHLDLRYEKSTENALGEITDIYSLVPRGKKGQIDFTDTDGIVLKGYKDLTNRFSPHDTGTFERHRHFLYSQLAENNIHYTLSGHSHRAGLYSPEKVGGMILSRMDVRVHGDENGVYPKLPQRQSRMIVSACGGPIAIQNHEGELFNWGLDTPSGSYIKFSGSQEKEIGIKRSKVAQAKPRLAVALDYADLMCKDKHHRGMFTRFESKKDGEPFTIELNSEIELPVEDWIESIELHALSNQTTKSFRFNLQYQSNGYTAGLNLSPADLLNLKKMGEKDLLFLQITLKQILADKLPADYDNSTPWTFQVDLLSRAKYVEEAFDAVPAYTMDQQAYMAQQIVRDREIKRAKGGGFIIRRHEKWGEVPWHWKYSDIDPYEYVYPWKENAELEDSK